MDSTLLPNVVAFLKTITPLSLLPESVLDAIAREAQILYLGKKERLESLSEQAESVYILQAGMLEQRFADGKLRARLGENDWFGFNLEQEDYRIIALENSLIYRFDYAQLRNKVKEYPEVANQLANSANLRLQSSIQVQWSESEKGIFFKPVKELANTALVFVKPEMSIQQVAQLMRCDNDASCALVVDNDKLLGIITDRNMTKRVVAQAKAVTAPIVEIMTPNPKTIAQEALVLSAVNIMMTQHIQHLPVVDNQQRVVGLITPEQLVQKHSVQAVFLIEKLRACQQVSELAALTVERQAIFEAMAEAKLPAQIIGQVLTLIYDAVTSQLLLLSERILGKPPCRYVWLAAGSHARGEIHLGSDQDNAFVLDEGATERDRVYFSHVAMYVCKGLAECGYPLCSGRFMAATPKWNQPLATWKAYYRKWAASPEYDKLLNLKVFLDIRLLAGDPDLFAQLDACRMQAVTANRGLMVALVRNALVQRPPLGIFNHLVLEKNGQNEKVLNIKKAAIGRLVDMARIFALFEGGSMLSTEARLAFSAQQGVINDHAYQDLIGTYAYTTQLRYHHHWRCLQQGEAISNAIQPQHFSSFERQQLKDAFRIVNAYQDVLKMKFGL